ncbi:hypothetical protein [Leptolyngbya sp. NIES-2104]|uniref:hypothetical protein n=1 Tax=Leptolyngbya sp. NIES-2104 TaxID=1552121 RepID=UPI00178CA011|nr:hypothetical protein [Leptolyngbya sp. NIES-2104]
MPIPPEACASPDRSDSIAKRTLQPGRNVALLECHTTVAELRLRSNESGSGVAVEVIPVSDSGMSATTSLSGTRLVLPLAHSTIVDCVVHNGLVELSHPKLEFNRTRF